LKQRVRKPSPALVDGLQAGQVHAEKAQPVQHFPDEIHHQLKLEALTERKNFKDKIVEILKNHCKAKGERKT